MLKREPKPIKGFNYSHWEVYQDYIDYLNNTPFQKEKLGSSVDDDYDIYGFNFGNLNNPTIVVISNQHGSEWETVHYTIKFFERLYNNYFYYSKTIKRFLSFYVIPMANPYGYLNLDLQNKNGVNLNRNWDYNLNQLSGEEPFSEPETSIIRDTINQYNPISVIDNHTWGHIPNEGNEHSGIGSGRTKIDPVLVNNTRNSISINTKSKISRWTPNDNNTLRNWASQRSGIYGKSCMSFLLEIGGDLDLYIQAKEGITSYYIFCLSIINYIKNRTLNFS